MAATFVRHDFVVGGRSEYHMNGPNGTPAQGMPTMRMRFAFEPHDAEHAW